MHRRGVSGHGSVGSISSVVGEGGRVNKLKRLDIYARPKREYQHATVHGAIVSFVAAVAVALLFWRELQFSLETDTVESLFVNSTISPMVNISFDVIFPRILCSMISIDAEDSTGTPQEGVEHHLLKIRLDLNGSPLDTGKKHALGNTMNSEGDIMGEDMKGKIEDHMARESGSEEECNCYGAGAEGECCWSCEEVRAAYHRKGWGFNAANVPICQKKEGDVNTQAQSSVEFKPVNQKEGCQLMGYLEVTKTEGNFHFAPGHKLHRQTRHLSFGDMLQMAFESFNSTHTINDLSFGQKVPGEGNPSPLRGHQRSVRDSHATHQYFLHIVPTLYRFSDGSEVSGSQYSVTEHVKHVGPGQDRGLPGVYFYYEVSPIQSVVVESRRGWLQFATSVCGVIGGVYTLLGLVNAGITGFNRERGSKRSGDGVSGGAGRAYYASGRQPKPGVTRGYL